MTATQITALVSSIGIGVSLILAAVLSAFPGAPKWLKVVAAFLADIFPNPALPSVRAQLRAPAKSGSTVTLASTLKIGVLFFALTASVAHAQVFTAGLSVPLLEFQPGNTHPVAFAPGAGLAAGVGFFPAVILGDTAEMLDISADLFANAPGSLQVAVTLGTFNNLICAGVAVPLYSSLGGGAAQGSFNVYPVIGGTVPIDLGSPPASVVTTVVRDSKTGAETSTTVSTPKRKLGTLYLGWF